MLEEKVTELLGQLAAKLGVASEKIWEWALLQVRVEIIKLLIALLAVFILGGVLFYIKTKIQLTKMVSYTWGQEKEMTNAGILFLIVCVFLGLVGLFVVVKTICSLPQYILNPEYSAFKLIIEQLSKLK